MQDTYDAEMEEVTSHTRATSSKAISDTIKEICNAIREGRECELDDDWDPTLIDIANQQIGIGQRAFIGGLWPLAWRNAQQEYYTRIRNTKSAAVWMSQTILKIQAVLYQMWKRRNKALHGDEDSAVNKARHEELDQAIDAIYAAKPHRCRLF